MRTTIKKLKSLLIPRMPVLTLVVVLALVTHVTFFSGCGINSGGDNSTMDAEGVAVSGSEGIHPAAVMPKDPFSGIGTLTSNSLYPLAVSIDNLSRARPQSGLSHARLVYELPVEGGITRFLAFFLEPQLDEVGPIRSVRPYFLDLASEYGAVLIHCGGSPEALARLSAGEVPHIDQIAESGPFYRHKDRSAPHNLYGRIEQLLQLVSKRFDPVGTDRVRLPWLISEEDVAAGLGNAEHISIKYWPGYTVEYTYAPDNGRYWRLINGNPHVSDDQPLAADHLIIQYADMDVLDDKGRLSFNASDGGKIVAFTGGNCVEGQWRRTTDGTVFSISGVNPETGAPYESRLTLKPGIVWVLVVPQKRSVTY